MNTLRLFFIVFSLAFISVLSAPAAADEDPLGEEPADMKQEYEALRTGFLAEALGIGELVCGKSADPAFAREIAGQLRYLGFDESEVVKAYFEKVEKAGDKGWAPIPPTGGYWRLDWGTLGSYKGVLKLNGAYYGHCAAETAKVYSSFTGLEFSFGVAAVDVGDSKSDPEVFFNFGIVEEWGSGKASVSSSSNGTLRISCDEGRNMLGISGRFRSGDSVDVGGPYKVGERHTVRLVADLSGRGRVYYDGEYKFDVSGLTGEKLKGKLAFGGYKYDLIMYYVRYQMRPKRTKMSAYRKVIKPFAEKACALGGKAVESGDTDLAETILGEVRFLDPSSKPAAVLTKAIDADPAFKWVRLPIAVSDVDVWCGKFENTRYGLQAVSFSKNGWAEAFVEERMRFKAYQFDIRPGKKKDSDESSTFGFYISYNRKGKSICLKTDFSDTIKIKTGTGVEMEETLGSGSIPGSCGMGTFNKLRITIGKKNRATVSVNGKIVIADADLGDNFVPGFIGVCANNSLSTIRSIKVSN